MAIHGKTIWLFAAGVLQVSSAIAADIDVGSTNSSSVIPDVALPAPNYLGGTISESSSDAAQNFWQRWRTIAKAAKASQPDWMTPIATVTPRLEQEFRSDQFFEQMSNGAHLDVYGGGKGFEFIPTMTNEVLINLPAYEERSHVKQASGWGDWPALTIKQRLISASRENGDYIVTAFMGVQAPTGDVPFTQDAWVVTPTLAAGKGWGDFDIQATVGVPIPLEHESEIGTSIVSNIAFQYHLGQYFWPEFEVNYTHWADGERSGKDQVFLTPGLVLGRFKLCDDSNLIVGLGYQFAVTPKTSSPVLTPTYDTNWIVTSRLSF
jgi:hypothetical protein